MDNPASSGIRAVSQPQTAKETTIFFDDLTNFVVGSGGNYYYFAFPTPDFGLVLGDDGVASYDSSARNLTIDSSTFTKLWSIAVPTPDMIGNNIAGAIGALDHVKYLVYRNGSIPLKEDGSDFVYEGVISAQQIFPEVLPSAYLEGITNINSDARLASSALNLIDFESWLVFDCFLTNETIYAVYERLPFGKPSYQQPPGTGPDYEAFTHLIPLSKRVKEGFDKIQVKINRKAGTVAWFVNGVEKYKINNLGVPIDRTYRFNNHGGTPTPVDLKQINVGFGNFTLMDFSNVVADVSLTLTMVDTSSIQTNLPLLQLDADSRYFDPQRVVTATGAPIPVGGIPFAGATPYDFIVKSDPDGDLRNFGQGAVMKLKYVRAYYSTFTQVVSQFPNTVRRF